MSSDRLPGTTGWTRPPLAPIPTVLRGQVLQMNQAYLDLLRSDSAGSPSQGLTPGLPETVVRSLAGLPPEACGRIAQCPVTLFNLRFEDADFWSGIGGATVAETESGQYAAPAPMAFVDTALFFAWHVVQCSELAARLLLAMPAATHQTFRELPLARLHRYAASCPQLLQPRWANHSCFWPDLIGAAARADPAALDAALLAGVQLVFNEVEPTALPRDHAGASTSRRRRPR